MRAGPLDRRITVQTRNVSQDPATGEEIEAWADLVTVWAEKIENVGQERFQSSQFIGKTARTFKVRWSNTMKAITVKHRVLFEGVPHEIEAVREGPGRHESIMIDCTERSENPVGA